MVLVGPLCPPVMALLMAPPTTVPTTTSPRVGAGATTTGAGAKPTPMPIPMGGAATTGGGAMTVVLLITVVLLLLLATGARGGGRLRAAGAEPPIRPPERAACASCTGSHTSANAAIMDRKAPPTRRGLCSGAWCSGSLRLARSDTRVLGSAGITGPTKAMAPSAAAVGVESQRVGADPL